MYTNMAKLWCEDLKRLRDRTPPKEPVSSAAHYFVTDCLFRHDAALRSESRAQELGLKAEEDKSAKFRKWLSLSSSSSSAINTMIDCLLLVD